jgi:hypothetical protein
VSTCTSIQGIHLEKGNFKSSIYVVQCVLVYNFNHIMVSFKQDNAEGTIIMKLG